VAEVGLKPFTQTTETLDLKTDLYG